MHPQQPSRRSKRTVRRREELDSSSDDSVDSSLTRVFIPNSSSNFQSSLPSSNTPTSSTLLMSTNRRTSATQTTQDNSVTPIFQSKSIPSFAETQLLSVYYLNRNITNQITAQDSCVFVEQQERQPIRFRASYDPLATTKETQTSPPTQFRQLSTHGSTLIVDANQQSSSTNNRLYEQRLKIHSGSQRLANNPSLVTDNEEPLSPSELVEESRYSYEEYIIHVDDKNQEVILPKQTSSSSTTTTSSVTTIIAQPSPPRSPPPPPPPLPVPAVRTMLQPEEFDSDRTSRLSGEENNTHSSASSMSGSFTNQDWQTIANTAAAAASNTYTSIVNTEPTTRVSSWPPVPYDLPPGDTHFETSFVLDESDEQRRPSRVQFAEQLVRVIPPSATNSLSEESAPPPLPVISAPAITPRTSTNRPSNIDIDEDETTTTTTTTSSNREPVPGRLQRTSGLTNLNEVMRRPPMAPPPPPPTVPPPPLPTVHPPPPVQTSTSASASTESGVDPRLVRDQLKRLDYQLVVDTRPPVNQSKWVKDHMDSSDVQAVTATNAGRVDALRSLFEQQSARSSDSSTLNSPTGLVRRKEPEERPSRHGDEIRFRVKDTQMPSASQPPETIPFNQRVKSSTNTPPAVAPMTWEDLVGVQDDRRPRPFKPSQPITSPSLLSSADLDEIRHITGKRVKTLDEVGSYLQDGHTWKWNDAFWFSLTPAQRDQLKNLHPQARSRQDSGDTQINEYSDRSAYQGDSEDNTPKIDHTNRRPVPLTIRTSSKENLSSASTNRTESDDTKRIQPPPPNDPGSTVSVSGAGAWQHSQQTKISTGIGKYTESSTIHESQPTVSVFGSTPTATYTRIGSQESIASLTKQKPSVNPKNENQMTIIESGYSSADEPQQQQRTTQFRPQSSTIIEEPSIIQYADRQSGVAGLVAGPGSIILSSNDIQLRDGPIYENLRPESVEQTMESELDLFSYEQFVYDYFSNHARRLRSDDGTLVLLIDGQQLQMSHIRLPSNDDAVVSRNVYIDAIDEYPPPFETELDQLVIFIHGEPIVLPADRWLFYKRKYSRAQWINNLDRVNRRIPTALMGVIEQWLSEHTVFLLDINEISVDGSNIPLIGRSGAQILDLYQVRQLQSNDNFFWSEILKYLIRTGYVSFDADTKVVQIGQSELDAERLLSNRASPSPELIERLANLLRQLNDIHFDNNHGRLILGDEMILSHDEIADLFEKYQQGQTLNATELANRLLRICDVDEDRDGQTLILTHDSQTLRLTPRPAEVRPRQSTYDEFLRQWFDQNIRCSTEHGRVFLIRYRSIPGYVVHVSGPDGLRLSNLLEQENLQIDDLLEWHENNVEFSRTNDSLRMIIKPNKNIEIVNLSLEENRKGREKVNEEKSRLTNEKTRKISEKDEEEEGKKNLVFFIPLQSQISSDNEREEKEREKNYRPQHSTSSPSPALLQLEEQKKLKSNGDDDDIDNAAKERALFLQSIASLLHFVNANGSDVGTLELIQGRRLRLTFVGNSPLSQQQQHIEFNEDETNVLVNELQLDIEACAQYLVDYIFENLQFDSQGEFLFLTYRGNMLKLKNLKQKFLQPAAKKLRLNSNKNNGSSSKKGPDEEQVKVLEQWLDQLNREQLITITDQNDIVILPNGDEEGDQQIFINHDDVDLYMEEKLRSMKGAEQSEVIGMIDIARILLLYNYVQYKDGQLTFGTQRIALDRNELYWLRSIIRGARPDPDNRETEVDLFDGEHTQVLRIPYEHMPPTINPRAVADYLFQNGHVRYDIDTGNYAYRYVPPDIPLEDEEDANTRLGQRQLLASHIRQIHVDEDNQRIELEFLHDSTHRLVLPANWYRQVANNRFDRAYIIDLLLNNGGVIGNDMFTFDGRTYSLQVPRVPSSSSANLAAGTNLRTLKLSSSQKKDLIEKYVELIHKQDGIKHDNVNKLLLLENPSDGSQLYLTPEHTDYVKQNQYRRQDVIRLLNKHGQIKQDEFGNLLLHYNNLYVQFPPSIVPPNIGNGRSSGQRSGSRQTPEEADAQYRARLAQETQEQFIERYHATIDYMSRHGLITCNRRLKLVQLHFSNQTLTIPLEQLRSIVDTRLLNSTNDALPFDSRRLSEWILEHSDTMRNTREGYIELTHKNKIYNFPFVNLDLYRREPSTGLSAIVKRFGLTSRTNNALSRLDFSNTDLQVRCANHLLEKIDQDGGINIDNETRTLILSMTPNDREQLTINNPVLPVTKQTLVDYLVTHGRFALNSTRTDIEYRHFDDGRVYHFNPYIRDWEEALGETGDERIVRVLGEILSLNGRFLQRADRQIIISLRNGERFVIPGNIGAQLIGPVNGQNIAELLVQYADDIYEEQDGKFLVIQLADQTLRVPQQRQLMSSKSSGATTNKATSDPKLKLLFPFNKSLRQIQRTPSTSTLNIQPPDASNGYAIDPLLMLANYIYRAGSIYQDDLGRLVIKMNEDEIVVPRIEAINAIETINTSPQRTGTIVARLIDRIGKVQSNRAGGLIITIGKSSFELPKELLDRANQLHREAIDIENDLVIADQDLVQTGLNGSMTLAGRHNRVPTGPPLLPLLRQSKSVGSLTTSTIGHPWFTDDQQMLYSKDGRGDARYLNLDNYSLAWQKEPHKHGVDCDVRTIRNVTPYFNVLGYTENDPKKAVTINDLTRLHPEMLTRGKMSDNPYLTELEYDRARAQTSICPKPRILVIPDDETMLSSNRKTRFYVQYMYDHNAVLGTDPAYVMMLPSRYPVRPTRPQLIAPHHYRDIALREAPVYVHRKGENEAVFENLAQYLSAEHPDVSPGTVRRMLKFNNRDEYLEYLSKKMPASEAEQLVRESEEPLNESSERYVNVPTRTGGAVRSNRPENDDDEDLDEEDVDDRFIVNDARRQPAPPRAYYNVKSNTANVYEDQPLSQQRRGVPPPMMPQPRQTLLSQGSMSNSLKFVERSPSTSSLGSDMLIANTLPGRRAVLGNAPSANIPMLRNDPTRTTANNPLSSLTDENYGRPVFRGSN